MANQKHVDFLRHGVAEWNEWREQVQNRDQYTTYIDIDLSGADLSGADLRDAYLYNVNLNEANLSKAYLFNSSLFETNLFSANLTGANLTGANLFSANLTGANLTSANLSGADLYNTNLSGADLSGADLSTADLGNADLTGADLSGADLSGADLSGADLYSTNFNCVTVNNTTFGELDLRDVKGLETVEHRGPSNLSINTIFRSEGHIPEVFLRGTGAPDSFIEYMHSLVNQSIQYYTCFISYSSKDAEFVDRLYTDLQSKNVRCWLDKEDLKIGDEFRSRIDEAIRFHDKVLLVLSEHSVESDWVETEVETAFDKEHKHKKSVLFPVTLDETIMDTDKAWAASIKRTRHIGDFTCWKDHDSYQKTFTRLLRDLKAERI